MDVWKVTDKLREVSEDRTGEILRRVIPVTV